jgi:predicted Fe-Mo cluster-binding NifX family protein
MQILIAAEGKTLESRVARKFSHAAFFLEVNPDARSVRSAVHTARTPKRTFLRIAAERGVDTLMAGHIDTHTRLRIAAHRLRVVLAPGLPIREALARFLKGSLAVLDVSRIEQSLEEQEIIRMQKRQEHSRYPGCGKGRPPFSDSTPRGRHHLQQFAGRGH